jgi:hypothetical protein
MFRSSVETKGGVTPDYPDYLYYNADIINNTTADLVGGAVVVDPQVRFNETRDTSLIKNASEYYFSIVRFTMNGPNKDLPLFIPDIQESTGQTNVNLTTYSLAIPYSQTWNVSGGRTIAFSIRPPSRFVQYRSETQNPFLAPTPRQPANPRLRGQFNVPAGSVYQIGDVVSTTAAGGLYGIFAGPFFQVVSPQQWTPNRPYNVGDFVQFQNVGYTALVNNPNPLLTPPANPAQWAFGTTGVAPPDPRYWEAIGTDNGSPQDLSSRYYWVYSYQQWLDLVNLTILNPAQLASPPGTASTCAIQDTYNEFAIQWANAGLVAPADPFPFATLQDFVNMVFPPQIVRDPSSGRFTIKADSDGFGTRLLTFTPQAYVAGPPGVAGQQTPPVFRLFFNSNMFGLFTNFLNTYWNTTDPTIGPFANTPVWLSSAGPTSGLVATPSGYATEILFPNKFYQNCEDYRLPPFSGVPPLGFAPAPVNGKVFWLNEQEYRSDDTLWSPISSIVFTSTLLPTRAEQTGPPVILGTGNNNPSAPTSQSAFQPIITDIALPMDTGASSYRQFLFYAPTAEYRLTDFSASKQPIRNIDIQVYWKNRLDNNLYPVSMFNLSSVSIKVMFRHKDAMTGGDDKTMVAL